MTRRNATQKPARSLVQAGSIRRIPRASLLDRYPFERRYRELDGDQEHPVDAVIRRIGPIASLDRKVLAQSRRWQEHVDDPSRYRDYEDLLLLQRSLREEAFFDAGHAEGRLVGRAESLKHSSTATAERASSGTSRPGSSPWFAGTHLHGGDADSRRAPEWPRRRRAAFSIESRAKTRRLTPPMTNKAAQARSFDAGALSTRTNAHGGADIAD